MSSHDIFICYSSKDEVRAREIVRYLEERQFPCWIACRDVRPGKNYQESIVQALRDAKIVVFLFSDSSNETGEVKKELSLASTFDTAVIPFRVTATTPNGALLYELATRQWIDAVTDTHAALEKLRVAVEDNLHVATHATEPRPTAPTVLQPHKAPRPAAHPTSRHAPMLVADSPEFEAIRMLLARYIGPIARVFVQKAGTEARTADELCEKLAAHVRSTADREAFRRAARALL